jgi:Zn ribbon nucleic-acid-binding protein
MTEIIFLVEDALERGLIARALGASICTEADNLDQLRERVRDAVRCHFDDQSRPKVIRLHYVRQEVIEA